MTVDDWPTFERRVIGVIVALGEGEVVSYGDIAHDAGYPGRARAVGALLARAGSDLPWWRVVRGDGRLVAAVRRRPRPRRCGPRA